MAQSGNPDLQWVKRKGLLSTSSWFILNCHKSKILTIHRKPPFHLRSHSGVGGVCGMCLACRLLLAKQPLPHLLERLCYVAPLSFLSQHPQVLGFTSVRHHTPLTHFYIYVYLTTLLYFVIVGTEPRAVCMLDFFGDGLSHCKERHGPVSNKLIQSLGLSRCHRAPQNWTPFGMLGPGFP